MQLITYNLTTSAVDRNAYSRCQPPVCNIITIWHTKSHATALIYKRKVPQQSDTYICSTAQTLFTQ